MRVYRIVNSKKQESQMFYLSLKNQGRLTSNEILFIMNVMKNLNNSYFDLVPELIKDLKIECFQ